MGHYECTQCKQHYDFCKCPGTRRALEEKKKKDKRTNYNKLVRDRIGDHLARVDDVVGFEIQTCQTPEEYKNRLRLKLMEEVEEFLDDPCAEEAADVTEVLHALLKEYNIPLFEVDDARFHKAGAKGRFHNGMVLLWVDRK